MIKILNIALVFLGITFCFREIGLTADNKVFIESEIETVHSSDLNFSQPGVSLGIGSFLSENLAVLIKMSRTLGQNFDSYHSEVGVEPVLSLPTVFSETINSITVFSILPRYRHQFRNKFEGTISAGPSLFEIEVEQSVKFVNGSSNRGGGENIPTNTDVAELGYGGTLQLGGVYRISESISFVASGQYFFGQYKRNIDFDRLTNLALESTFGNLSGNEHFSGFSAGLGVGFHF